MGPPYGPSVAHLSTTERPLPYQNSGAGSLVGLWSAIIAAYGLRTAIVTAATAVTTLRRILYIPIIPNTTS